ncbi:Rieske 2Fe-2S domain-containing protein [Ramlibacter sp. AW1]|uniref:Rieske 2Fe-2S domain-containing protein n=1 Tax=Ramlibacter aurantiacus TaxID=2801330 RepID=A0A936ZPW4_9BURK|nr:Rieske 2Fe-2S domain-containing protein [Ramlibacter aurantiacus]MBL0420296.1 Rieske 2Fe-2S domain-containing protein [Ramlibacter aurantiacus]
MNNQPEARVRFTRQEEPRSAQILQRDERTFRVHTSAYTDERVFREEMDKVFAKTWVYVGHASEIPKAGDFKTSHIGLQPVVVSRGEDDTIHVFVNRCVHRGAVLTRDARGNATEFNCPYHGWVYGIDGRLIAVSERREPGGYSENFRQPEGLFRLPRVATYRGFIFASFNADAPGLEAFLGRARSVIDRKLNLAPGGEIVLRSRPFVVRYQGNWKFQAENIVDAYHFLHTHKGFVNLQARFGDTTGDFGVHKGGSVKEMRKLRFQGATWSCAHGHGMLENPSSHPETYLEGEFSSFYEGIRRTHGDEEFAWLVGKGAVSIFPNVGMIHQQIRTWRPIAPDVTEVTIYPYELKDAPDAYNEGMLRSQERFYGPAGHGAADDVDIFSRNQQGLLGSAVDWLILERGLDTDELVDGDWRGLPASEAPQRALWRAWARLMCEEQT